MGASRNSCSKERGKHKKKRIRTKTPEGKETKKDHHMRKKIPNKEEKVAKGPPYKKKQSCVYLTLQGSVT